MNPPQQWQITIVTSHSENLSKRFWLDEQGNIQSSPQALLYEGQGQVVTLSSMEQFARVLQGLTPKQAIVLGVPKCKRLHSGFEIVTSKAERNAVLMSDALARSKRNIGWPEGRPGAMLLDEDYKGCPDHLLARIRREGGGMAVVARLVPELEGVACLGRPSSSDGVRKSDGSASNQGGTHKYVKVEKAETIPNLTKVIGDRLWAAGYGWVLISASGARLFRTIIDVSVASPERLIFEGQVTIGEGLEHKPRPMHWNEGRALPLFKNDVQTRLLAETNRTVARHQAQPAARAQHLRWIEKQAVKLMKEEPSLTIEQARHAVEMRGREDNRRLHDNDFLELNDGTKVRVKDLFYHTDRLGRRSVHPDDRKKWNELYIPDPAEGLGYGISKAQIIMPTNRGVDPYIISYAHGTTIRYRFARYYQVFSAPPDTQVHGASLVEAWAMVADANGELMRRVRTRFNCEGIPTRREAPLAGQFLTMGIRGGTGTGKSEGTRRFVVDHMLPALRQMGFKTPVYMVVPNHHVVDEYVAALAKLDRGWKIGAMRGRGQLLPGTDPYKESFAPTDYMCRRREAVEALHRAGGKPSALCKYCPFQDDCAYLSNKQSLGEYDIVVLPHQYLTQPPPGLVFPARLSMMVVDENPLGALLEKITTIGGKPVGYDVFYPEHWPDTPKATMETVRQAMATISNDLLRVAQSGRGEVRGADLTVTADECKALARYAKAVMTELDISDDDARMVEKCRKVELHNERCRWLRIVAVHLRQAVMTKMFHPNAVVTCLDLDMYTLAVTVFRRPDPAWRSPTLYLDATMQPAIAEKIFPGCMHAENLYSCELDVDWSRVYIRQIHDRSNGKAAIVGPEDETDASDDEDTAEQRRRAERNRMHYLHTIEATQAMLGAPNIGLVTYKGAADWYSPPLRKVLRAADALEPATKPDKDRYDGILHYNKAIGVNSLQDFRYGCILGRPLPTARAMRQDARAMNGGSPVGDDEYERALADVGISKVFRDASGSIAVSSVSIAAGEGYITEEGYQFSPGVFRHAHELVETLRWTQCEGNLLQAIGRFRLGLRRQPALASAGDPETDGPSNGRGIDVPLFLDIFTNIPVGIPVNEITRGDWVLPNTRQLLEARGVVPASMGEGEDYARIVAEMLPDVYSSMQTVRDAVNEKTLTTRSKPYMDEDYLREWGQDVPDRQWHRCEIVMPGERARRYTVQIAATDCHKALVRLRISMPDAELTWFPREMVQDMAEIEQAVRSHPGAYSPDPRPDCWLVRQAARGIKGFDIGDGLAEKKRSPFHQNCRKYLQECIAYLEAQGRITVDPQWVVDRAKGRKAARYVPLNQLTLAFAT